MNRDLSHMRQRPATYLRRLISLTPKDYERIQSLARQMGKKPARLMRIWVEAGLEKESGRPT